MIKIDSFTEILDNFDGFLFDAYGVLVDAAGPLSGSIDLLCHLKSKNKPFLIVSNGSSKTARDTAQGYMDMGFPLEYDEVLTSGGMLGAYLEAHTQVNDKIAVLGTDGSMSFVRDCKRIPVNPLDAHGDFAYLVIANQTEYPFLEAVDECLSQICHKLDRGLPIKVIVTNPDLFYPKEKGTFGITAGSIAKILELSVQARYGLVPEGLFHGLGKPYSPMFASAIEKLQTRKLLMVGDQIPTDIKGAKNAGLKSLLLGSGLTDYGSLANFPENLLPDYYLDSLKATP